ncbi:hypothetical protein ACPWSG_25455, partial [Pandoraea pneumonica]
MAKSSRKIKQFVIPPGARSAHNGAFKTHFPGASRPMESPRRVLLVEDDVHIADLLTLHLRDER